MMYPRRAPVRPEYHTREIARMLVRGQIFCKYCGQPLPPDAKKCPKCGKPVKPRD